MTREIRLECLYCDTACHGIDEIPADWNDVEEIQTSKPSIEETPVGDLGPSPVRPYTHLGVCPECSGIKRYVPAKSQDPDTKLEIAELDAWLQDPQARRNFQRKLRQVSAEIHGATEPDE